MSQPNAVDLIGTLGLDRPATATSPTERELGQAEFLRLLTTELRFQDPTQPLDSKEFLSQIAQFTSVDGIQGMERALQEVATTVAQTQMLQAAAVVGRQALAPVSELLNEAGETVRGKVQLTAAVPDLEILVRDSAGVQIARIDLGAQQPGLVPFQWDGTLPEGGQAPQGIYRLSAQAALGDDTVPQAIYLWRPVESVSLGGAAGPSLNIPGAPALVMDQIIEFA